MHMFEVSPTETETTDLNNRYNQSCDTNSRHQTYIESTSIRNQ